MTQIRCRAAMKSTSSPQPNERRRTPQPQRPIVQAVARYASQRIGVGERPRRRPHTGGGRKGEEHQDRLMLGSDHRKAERGRKGGDNHGTAYRLTPFGKAGHERQNREPRHRRNCRDDPDPRRVDSNRLQPYREKRQVGAQEAKQRGVKQRQPRRESAGRHLRCDGDL
jgi:hypothetical protein